MNLLSLITACEARTGFNDSNYRSNWRSFINEGIREFGRRYPWPGLEDLLQVSSDGTRFLVLPHFVDTIISILNKTNSVPVNRVGHLDRDAPYAQAQRTAGTVIGYDKVGTTPILRDPTGYLTVYSTSATDVSQSFTVTGYVNNSGASGTGLERSVKVLEVFPTGNTTKTLSELFASVISISKATDFNGDLFFRDAGDSDKHISFLGQYDLEASFKRVQLLYAPASQTLFEVKFRHKIPPLRLDSQGPPPAVDPDFVTHFAIGLHYKEQQQFSKGQVQEIKALDVLQQRAHKEENFDEPFNVIFPDVDRCDRDFRP